MQGGTQRLNWVLEQIALVRSKSLVKDRLETEKVAKKKTKKKLGCCVWSRERANGADEGVESVFKFGALKARSTFRYKSQLLLQFLGRT